MEDKMQIVVTNNRELVESLVEQGFCPVECSIDGQSITDALQIDHHGALSHLESVAVRAYRDHFGARASDPRFVVVGTPDADATFAIASLAGLLPHPERDVTGVPAYLVKGLTQDLSGLAETVAVIDTDPIGRDITMMPGGDILLTWNALMAGVPNDSLDGFAGVQLWRTLTAGHPAQKPLLTVAKESEEGRIEEAKANLALDGIADVLGPVLVLDGTTVFGFDVWYGRQPEAPADSLDGWKHPVVLSRAAHSDAITVGCPNKTVAEKVFGEGGLKNVFSALQPAGWGGRESVGGSPRGTRMSREQLIEAAQVLHAHLL